MDERDSSLFKPAEFNEIATNCLSTIYSRGCLIIIMTLGVRAAQSANEIILLRSRAVLAMTSDEYIYNLSQMNNNFCLVDYKAHSSLIFILCVPSFSDGHCLQP